MPRTPYKTSIPAEAREVVEASHPDGGRKSASYLLGAEKVGHREWDEGGQLEFEYAMRNGVKHGRQYRFHPNGQVLEEDNHREGRLHGIGRQWAEDGTLLVSWKLVDGCGLDLWCNDDGTLAEEHYWPKVGELGYTRQWNHDERTIWQEYFYVLGKGYHGVWREWIARGRLRRGFPHFYINDHRVTKRQFLKASEGDPTLLPYRPEDDDPQRELPAEYRAQRQGRGPGGDDT